MDKTKTTAWFIIILMSLSVIGYVGGSFFIKDTTPQIKYNGFTLTKNGNYWQLVGGNKVYNFLNSPQDLESFSIPVDISSWQDKVYLGYSPNNPFNVQPQLLQLTTILYDLNIRPQPACLVEHGCPDIPLLNCQQPGIVLKQGPTTLSVDQNCLVLSAPDTIELQKITERLIYHLLGVMN